MHTLLLTATLLLPFGVAAGDELVSHRTSGPVSLSCQYYGVEEDTLYVRKKNLHLIKISHCSMTYKINSSNNLLHP